MEVILYEGVITTVPYKEGRNAVFFSRSVAKGDRVSVKETPYKDGVQTTIVEGDENGDFIVTEPPKMYFPDSVPSMKCMELDYDEWKDTMYPKGCYRTANVEIDRRMRC